MWATGNGWSSDVRTSGVWSSCSDPTSGNVHCSCLSILVLSSPPGSSILVCILFTSFHDVVSSCIMCLSVSRISFPTFRVVCDVSFIFSFVLVAADCELLVD